MSNRFSGRRLHDPRRRQQKSECRGERKSSARDQEPASQELEAEARRAARGRSRRFTGRSSSALATMFMKNGFQKVVLGLSGGIDSALTACVAVDASGQRKRRLAF